MTDAPAEAWVPTPEELEQLARTWVVKNAICGHTLIAGQYEACAQALGVTKGIGWSLTRGATPMDMENIARATVCQWCAQPRGAEPTIPEGLNQ